MMGDHLIDGEFQSDKYPTTPRGKVPLSCKDPMAQDLLWDYAQRRRTMDAEFADDLAQALKNAGYKPPAPKVDSRLLPAHLSMMRHALGTDRGGVACRNHYAAGRATSTERLWRDLERVGWAEKMPDGACSETTIIFRVTDAGREALMIREA